MSAWTLSSAATFAVARSSVRPMVRYELRGSIRLNSRISFFRLVE